MSIQAIIHLQYELSLHLLLDLVWDNPLSIHLRVCLLFSTSLGIAKIARLSWLVARETSSSRDLPPIARARMVLEMDDSIPRSLDELRG